MKTVVRKQNSTRSYFPLVANAIVSALDSDTTIVTNNQDQTINVPELTFDPTHSNNALQTNAEDCRVISYMDVTPQIKTYVFDTNFDSLDPTTVIITCQETNYDASPYTKEYKIKMYAYEIARPLTQYTLEINYHTDDKLINANIDDINLFKTSNISYIKLNNQKIYDVNAPKFHPSLYRKKLFSLLYDQMKKFDPTPNKPEEPKITITDVTDEVDGPFLRSKATHRKKIDDESLLQYFATAKKTANHTQTAKPKTELADQMQDINSKNENTIHEQTDDSSETLSTPLESPSSLYPKNTDGSSTSEKQKDMQTPPSSEQPMQTPTRVEFVHRNDEILKSYSKTYNIVFFTALLSAAVISATIISHFFEETFIKALCMIFKAVVFLFCIIFILIGYSCLVSTFPSL